MKSRPYIICHMVASLDGKVTGDFLFDSPCRKATEIYYRINREKKCDGFICGRVTMEESFTGTWYPELTEYRPIPSRTDFVPDDLSGFFAVAFDTNGKLGWKSNQIIDPDGDPGYEGARVLEVLSEDVDDRYLGYLEERKIPYLFAGKNAIDVNLALTKLWRLFGCRRLLLEGGSEVNGSFERADAVDEISLVVAPVIAGGKSKPLFSNASLRTFELQNAEGENGTLLCNYKKCR